MRLRRLVGFALILLSARTADGQEPVRDEQIQPIRAVVDQVAGTTLYLNVGRDGGIITNDTVHIARDTVGEALGALVVLRSTASRSVLAFAGKPFSITRGQVLFVTPSGAAVHLGAGAPGAEEEALADGLPVAGARRPYTRSGVLTSGSVSLDVAVLQSQARFGSADNQTVDRTFATPALRIRTTITQPQDWTFELRTHVSHRYASTGTQINPTSVRVYEASFEKTFRNKPLRFQLGRFYNRYETYSGYWDGVLARVGGRKAGFGVAVGVEPDRSNQAVSSDLPKASAFVNYRSDGRRVRYEVDASVHRVEPQNGLLTHTFAGLSQRLRVGHVRFDQELQFDEDPVAGGWEVTRFQLNMHANLQRRVQLRTGVSRQRPYRLFDTLSVISHPRDQISAGLRVRVGPGSVSGDVAVNRDQDGDLGYSYSAYLGIPGSRMLGMLAAASYQTGPDYRALALSPGLTGNFGQTRASLSYRFYRYEYDLNRLFTTHTVRGRLDIPAGRGLRYRIQGSGQWGGSLTSSRLYAGLTKTF